MLLEAMRPTRSIRGQTALLAAALIVLGVLGVAGAVWTQAAVKQAGDRALQVRSIQVQVDMLQLGMVNQQAGLRGYRLTGLSEFLRPYDLGRQQVADAELKLDRLEAGDPTRPSYKSMKTAAGAWESWAQKLTAEIETRGAGDVDVDESFMDSTLFESFRAAADRFEHDLEQHVARAQAEADAQSARLVIILPALALIGLIILLLLLSVFFRSTLAPVRDLIEVASRLARGQVVAIPQVGRADEVGSLARALAAWQQASHEQLALSQSMLELTQEVRLETVLELGIERLREVLGAAQVMVVMRTPNGAELAACQPHAPPSDWDEDKMSGTGLWQSETTVLTDLSRADPETGLRAWASSLDLGPALVMPMVSAGRPLGAAVVLRRTGEPAFDSSDLLLAQVIVPALGAAIHVSSLFADLTRVNADLERASRVKSQFLANVSHELRTPLNSILGFAQLLESGDFGHLNERQQRYTKHISSSGRQLLELINDMLDLSKIEAGKLDVSPEVTWVEIMLEECVAEMRPAAGAKQIDMRIRTAPDLRAWADPRRLRQVLLNLLSNAIKFTPQGGRIAVEATESGDSVELVVSDNGIGIKPEHLGMIFDEFTQIDSRLSREAPGSGLGLPLSRSLVEIMGGSIAVESTPGAGSKFTVRLPAAALEKALV